MCIRDSGIPVPVVFTVRSVREGGFFAGNESERLGILQKAIDSGVTFVDIELSIATKERNKLTDSKKIIYCSDYFQQARLKTTLLWIFI